MKCQFTEIKLTYNYEVSDSNSGHNAKTYRHFQFFLHTKDVYKNEMLKKVCDLVCSN